MNNKMTCTPFFGFGPFTVVPAYKFFYLSQMMSKISKHEVGFHLLMPTDFYGVARNVITRSKVKKSRKVAFQFWRHFASAAYKTAYKFS